MLLKALTLAFSLFLIEPSLALAADDPAPASQCEKVADFKKTFPASELKLMPEKAFQALKDTFEKLGNPVPEQIVTVYMGYTMQQGDGPGGLSDQADKNAFVFLGFDKDGCFVTYAHMSKELFLHLFGTSPDGNSSYQEKEDNADKKLKNGGI